VILEKGTNKIRFIFDQGGSNLNYFKFSNPIHTDSLNFSYLYSETSTDGETVSLHLNKTVTTSSDEINPADFVVSINNNPVVVNSVSVTGNQNILLLRVAEKLYYGGTIRLTYNGSTVVSNNQSLETFSNVVVTNKLPVRYNLPGRIQSENFYFNNGMVSETCTDAGGGFNMGYANPGDYLDYHVYVPSAGNYKFNFRVASERSSSEIIIRTGEGNSFTAVDTVTITGTGGWQTWKTISSTAHLPEGRYTLRMYVRSGEFNINWFEAAKAPVTGIETGKLNGFSIYPNPAVNVVNIETVGTNTGEKTILFYNSVGQIVKTRKYFDSKPIEIDISDLSKGLYFVEVKAVNGFKQTTKLIIQ
jgi:endoglucanase